ncbi:MAG: O-antigen ligase family protein [Cyanobacteria bacterium P01_C01_bin.118]
MLTRSPSPQYPLIIAATLTLGILGGLVAGFVSGVDPLIPIAAFVAIGILITFFSKFETVLLGLLVLRSSLDILSDYQIPALLAIGLDVLALIYVAVAILTRQPIKTDKFWWFFLGWVFLQGMWVVLLPLGGLGMGSSLLSESIREWIRFFSMTMVYLLVMQLKGKFPPQRLVSILLLSLIVPLTAAAIQIVIPPSMLPSLLVFDSGGTFEAGSRINGTLGHPATFSSFTVWALGLAYWKFTQATRKLPWLILVATAAFFLVSSKALTGLIMMMVFVVIIMVPRLNIVNLLGTVVFIGLVIALFGSSEFGQERLGSIGETPLLNPDIDHSRAILLSWRDGNSFNWRIAQWTFLLDAWREHPIFGHGIGSSKYLTYFSHLPHNDYIGTLTERGIVGLITFLIFLGTQFVRLLKLMMVAPRNGGQWTLCLVLIALLLSMMMGMVTDNILTHTTLFFYWWTLFAIAGWDWEEVPKIPDYYQPQLHSYPLPTERTKL